jgi:hypothetical protein
MKNNKEIQSNIASESNAVSYSNSYNKSNSQSYNEWLEAKENLFNTYFDITLQGRLRTLKVQSMHITPKIFENDFLEIGVTDNEDKICIYVGNDKHENFSKGSICLYGWLRFDERYDYDSKSNEVEYFQDDVYGFSHIAADFSKFLEILYCNG